MPTIERHDWMVNIPSSFCVFGRSGVRILIRKHATLIGCHLSDPEFESWSGNRLPWLVSTCPIQGSNPDPETDYPDWLPSVRSRVWILIRKQATLIGCPLSDPEFESWSGNSLPRLVAICPIQSLNPDPETGYPDWLPSDPEFESWSGNRLPWLVAHWSGVRILIRKQTTLVGCALCPLR
jgi:hypothetical protein